ncbi:cell division protein SepF [Vagococcus zengguangii]|uniref:Cell division protein SepF n=1 Tax=Vagococcus zengguangii TaxID=2571750 RepID=A0A4D7CRF7_9ENTE|nr:cell division protein SepF [Vagococcus zengguangii]QCI86755.1 DUF552 domain-containing protein [Vagococcus zengguangii]
MKFALSGENIKKFFGLDFAIDQEVSPRQPEVAYPAPKAKQPLEKQVFQKTKEVAKPVPQKQPAVTSQEKVFKQEKQVAQAFKPSVKKPVNEPVRESNILSMESAASNKNTKLAMNKKIASPNVAGEPVKKVTIFEPRTYAEVKKVASAFLKNEIVIVNFHLVDEEQAKRIVDFLTGVVFALDGDIQRLDNELFICTPTNLEVDSETAESLLKSHLV